MKLAKRVNVQARINNLRKATPLPDPIFDVVASFGFAVYEYVKAQNNSRLNMYKKLGVEIDDIELMYTVDIFCAGEDDTLESVLSGVDDFIFDVEDLPEFGSDFLETIAFNLASEVAGFYETNDELRARTPEQWVDYVDMTNKWRTACGFVPVTI